MNPKPSVLVCSSSETLDLAHQLANRLESDASVLIWIDAVFRPGRPVVEAITTQLSKSDFAIMIVGEDDVATPRPVSAVRSNVIFEIGLAIGALGQSRVQLVAAGRVPLPTDLSGLPIYELSPNSAVQLDTIATAIARKVTQGDGAGAPSQYGAESAERLLQLRSS